MNGVLSVPTLGTTAAFAGAAEGGGAADFTGAGAGALTTACTSPCVGACDFTGGCRRIGQQPPRGEASAKFLDTSCSPQQAPLLVAVRTQGVGGSWKRRRKEEALSRQQEAHEGSRPSALLPPPAVQT